MHAPPVLPYKMSTMPQKRSRVSLYQLLGFGCVACLIVFLLRTSPDTSRSVAVEHFEEAETTFARQELNRMRCLKDLRRRLLHDFGQFFEGSNKKVALMDVALLANLGDNILWKAALDLIAAFGISPDIVCYVSQKGFMEHIDNAFESCDIAKIADMVQDGGLVLIQGGGNWGDLYRYVQEERVNYLKELTRAAYDKNFTVVQLPQSIAYSPESVYLESDNAVMQQIIPDTFVFMARQQDTYEFAQRYYTQTESFLTLDLAYFLGPLLPSHAPTYDVLIQMRQDVEVVKSDEEQYGWLYAQLKEANMTFDYRDWWYHPEDHEEEISYSTPSLLGHVRLNAAIDLISDAKIIITNRLHGSILASLLGKHVFVVDTVEGKLGRVHDIRRTASRSCSDVNLHTYPCRSLKEAVSRAIALHKQIGTVYN